MTRNLLSSLIVIAAVAHVSSRIGGKDENKVTTTSNEEVEKRVSFVEQLAAIPATTYEYFRRLQKRAPAPRKVTPVKKPVASVKKPVAKTSTKVRYFIQIDVIRCTNCQCHYIQNNRRQQ